MPRTRGDRAGPFEGGRRVGGVAHLEQALAAQVGGLAGGRVERLRAGQRLDRRRRGFDAAEQQRREVTAGREPTRRHETASRLAEVARPFVAQALFEQPLDFTRAEHEVA